MQQIPVFVISMKSAVTRRASIERHLTGLGIEYEIFEAVRGADLGETKLRELNPSGSRTPGSVGTYMSQMGVYQLMLDRDLPVALVLEDDAVLLPPTRALLQAGCRSLDFDICYLGCDDEGDAGFIYLDTQSAFDLGAGLTAYVLSGGPYCLHAYLITRAGAEKRLAEAFPIRTPIDHYSRMQTRMRFAAVVPMIGFLNEESAVGSVAAANWSALQSQLKQRWWYYPLRDLVKLRALRKWLARREARVPYPGRWRAYRSALRVIRQ